MTLIFFPLVLMNSNAAFPFPVIYNPFEIPPKAMGFCRFSKVSGSIESFDFIQIVLAPESITHNLRVEMPSLLEWVARSFLTLSFRLSDSLPVSRYPTFPTYAFKSLVREYLPPNANVGRQANAMAALRSHRFTHLFLTFCSYFVLNPSLGGLFLNSPTSITL